MPALPARGPGVRELGLPLPPRRMPSWRQGRPLKRWHYLGVYTRQPFGTFSGELPGGLRLAEGAGVMEDHDVWW